MVRVNHFGFSSISRDVSEGENSSSSYFHELAHSFYLSKFFYFSNFTIINSSITGKREIWTSAIIWTVKCFTSYHEYKKLTLSVFSPSFYIIFFYIYVNRRESAALDQRMLWANRLFSKTMKGKILNFLYEVEKMISVISVQV